MYLAEPPPSQGDFHFSLLGFPVRIHPFFWLTTVVMGMQLPPNLLLLWVVAVLLSILLHELGHAVVMRYYGSDAAIVLYSFGGLAIPRRGRYGSRQLNPWQQINISFAGPASGFILAALLALGLNKLGGCPVEFLRGSWRDVAPVVGIPGQPYLSIFVNFVFDITVWWGLMNLLPVFPLDGGQIALQLFILYHPHDAFRQAMILSVMVGGAVCIFAFMQKEWYVGLLFLWLAYSNIMSLQSYRGW